MKNIVSVLAVVLLAACQKKAPDVKIAPKPQSLDAADWLIGSWQENADDGLLTETWNSESDSTFAGKTVFVVGNDTAFSENIRLIARHGSLVYATRVSDQNDGDTIEFQLTSASPNILVFENPEHDYPTRIAYQNYGDSIVATISGTKLGVEIKENFGLKRVGKK